MANVLTSQTARNIGTTITTVYTTPASTTATLIGLNVCNITTNVIYVTVHLSRSATLTHLVKNAMVPPGGALSCVGVEGKHVLVAGDLVRVTSDTASSVDTIVSVLEQS